MEIRAAIDEAARASGRASGDVTLLAVSKTFPPEDIALFLEAGQKDFGESYIQEAREKIPQVPLAANWHFIGRLQTNKAKYAARLFSHVHALDSLELAAELHKRLIAQDSSVSAFIQVNVSGEESKNGMEPDELPRFLDALAPFSAVVPVGLMTIPPYDPDPEESRRHFRALYETREKYAPRLPGLSMGMSGDFQVAISEGATVVRVGTALFGPR
jgi:pyridoxal phosphate enzyme (YggS family)